VIKPERIASREYLAGRKAITMSGQLHNRLFTLHPA